MIYTIPLPIPAMTYMRVARLHLIEARLYKQKAEQAEVVASFSVTDCFERGRLLTEAKRWRDLAKTHRAKAKMYLTLEERDAGREFCEIGYTRRGAKNLSPTAHFLGWGEYCEIFAKQEDVWL